MIKVYWTEISDRDYKKSRVVFLIPIPAYHFVIKSINFLPGNKRRGTPRSKFLHSILVKLEMTSNTDLECFSSFEITEKEFVRWIGRISLDQVPELEDIGWIMKVKKDIEEEIKKKE